MPERDEPSEMRVGRSWPEKRPGRWSGAMMVLVGFTLAACGFLLCHKWADAAAAKRTAAAFELIGQDARGCDVFRYVYDRRIVMTACPGRWGKAI